MQSLDQQETGKYQDVSFMLFAILSSITNFLGCSKNSVRLQDGQICPHEYALKMLIKQPL